MKSIRAWTLLLLWGAILASCTTDDADVTTVTTTPPFDAVLVELFGTTDTDEYLSSAERDAAELVVTCMNAAGFEFQIPAETDDFVPPAPDDLDAARTLGFGIIEGFRHQVAQSDPSASLADPNQVYLSTLSGAEIERFFRTLDGVEAEPGQRRDDAGCNGWASEQAYADWTRFFEALPNFTVLGEERDTHPDWVAARMTWRLCMVDRGFDYAEPDAIRTDVISRMRASVNEVYPGGQVPLIEQDGVFMVDPGVDDLLNELVQFERDAAVANIECTEPVAEQFRAVELEVQQAFVERNQAAIDELLDAAK